MLGFQRNLFDDTKSPVGLNFHQIKVHISLNTITGSRITFDHASFYFVGLMKLDLLVVFGIDVIRNL